MNLKSVRFRLSAWYAGLFGLVVVGLAAVFFLHLRSWVDDTLWDIQARRAGLIADTLVADIGASGEAGLGRQIAARFAPEKSERFIRVLAPGGRIVYVSGAPISKEFDPADVPIGTAPATVEARWRQPMPRSADLLIASSRADVAGTQYWVEVGTSSSPVQNLFHHLLVLLAVGLPVVVLLAAMGGYWLVRRALHPVEQMTLKAQLITQHSLSERLPAPQTGDELERLSLALNLMITRLDDAFQNSKRFVADASHELRTPLTILRGELESLAQDASVPAAERERLGSLLEEVERLAMIVERLFALSRLDAGEAQAEWVRVDLAQLAFATVNQMTLLAEDRKMSLAFDGPNAVFVEGDRARLKQVIVNLLDNAIKYTPDGGAVQLRVRRIGNRAVLEVADTGVGIGADDLPHVFDRFFRADKARSRQPDGAGLGLAIVKSICHAHRGEIEAESTPGKGSCFRVSLPIADQLS